jgi:hypothetical protein
MMLWIIIEGGLLMICIKSEHVPSYLGKFMGFGSDLQRPANFSLIDHNKLCPGNGSVFQRL